MEGRRLLSNDGGQDRLVRTPETLSRRYGSKSQRLSCALGRMEEGPARTVFRAGGSASHAPTTAGRRDGRRAGRRDGRTAGREDGGTGGREDCSDAGLRGSVVPWFRGRPLRGRGADPSLDLDSGAVRVRPRYPTVPCGMDHATGLRGRIWPSFHGPWTMDDGRWSITMEHHDGATRWTTSCQEAVNELLPGEGGCTMLRALRSLPEGSRVP